MKNKGQNTPNLSDSQLAKANAALKGLAHNVTTDDRKEAGFSEFTVVQYLTGKGKDLGTAIKLLEFFRNRIAMRDKLLTA